MEIQGLTPRVSRPPIPAGVQTPAEVTASVVNVHAPVANFDGVINCTTLIASTGVVSPSYTPGAGNVW